MTTPKVMIGLVANMFVRQMHFEKSGDCEIGHTHPFDHLTLLASGSVDVKVNGKTTTFTAPSMIYIEADTVHELTSLEPNTVAYCIHGLRDENKSDDIISPDMVPEGAELAKMILNLADMDYDNVKMEAK